MKRYALIFVLLPVVALAAGCGGKKSNTTSASPGSTTTSAATPKMNQHGVKDVSGMSSLEVEMDDYYFSPTVIKGKPGQQLTLNLSNHGTVEHNFTITSQGLNRDVEPKKTAGVQVTLPQSGTLVFYCKYHKSLGMAGELTTGSGGMSGGGSSGSSTTSSGY
jgi:plastocyanin